MPKNVAFAAARTARNLTQEELAEYLGVAKRTVTRWENGVGGRPQAVHVRKLQDAMGIPVERLGFPADKNAVVLDDGQGGHDLAMRFPPITAPARAPASDYSGIWLSRYEYFSSSREQLFSGQHFVVLQQVGADARVRSLLNSANSTLAMDLTVSGVILNGTWVEDTDKTGYYRGKTYVGAVHLIADPSGSRLAGKWVGHGKNAGEVNTGVWRLDYQAPATSRTTVDSYDRLPND
jgi:transcriptional regulator with XRE-family HTH domain